MKSKLNLQYRIVLVIFIASLLMYAVYVSYNYHVEKFADAMPTVALFFATWCGHCTNYEKSHTFDNVTKVMEGKVNFVKYDYDMNKALANKMGINAFPSIVLIDANGKKIVDFEGDIYNTSALVEFANKAIAS